MGINGCIDYKFLILNHIETNKTFIFNTILTQHLLFDLFDHDISANNIFTATIVYCHIKKLPIIMNI